MFLLTVAYKVRHTFEIHETKYQLNVLSILMRNFSFLLGVESSDQQNVDGNQQNVGEAQAADDDEIDYDNLVGEQDMADVAQQENLEAPQDDSAPMQDDDYIPPSQAVDHLGASQSCKCCGVKCLLRCT